ncbi:DNA-binding response regulator [Actinorhabdospora filicis]|uniref:DNA-binding response regulator n=1 Tax=Actinorhabdospora filicis TaxID=1785913 RepID=A0A9W6SPD4_9ACTN|nr:response regulator transcription factor [Actinorhabdospora filicis]GLZ79678.1 DNA-binding response regulator [Actinorhabdospora filicis]
MIRVLLADDQALIRAGFAALLGSVPGIEVVAEAADGAQALARAREHRPDVVFMDVQMPGVNGIEATRAITADPDLTATRVVMLTNYELDVYVFEALRAGACGFLLKDTEPAELMRAARIAVDGGALLSPGATRRLVAEYVARPPTPVTPPGLDRLTAREREILTLVGAGLSNHDIAARLHITGTTAKTHVSRVIAKLGARDRAQLVVAAYEGGLVVARGDQGWTGWP